MIEERHKVSEIKTEEYIKNEVRFWEEAISLINRASPDGMAIVIDDR